MTKDSVRKLSKGVMICKDMLQVLLILSHVSFLSACVCMCVCMCVKETESECMVFVFLFFLTFVNSGKLS